MKYMKIKYRLLVYLSSFTEDIYKKESSENKKKSSENDQLTGHFQSFFFIYFFRPPPPPPPPPPPSPPTLNLKKNPKINLIKKFWPKHFSP